MNGFITTIGDNTVRIGFVSRMSVFLIIAVATLGTSATVLAQEGDAQAISLKKEAMNAYGNLDLDGAIQLLDQAAAMGEQLTANTVAQIYISYGVVLVGGQGDNARGQDYFAIARCLDASISIDPLYSSPEVEMIFKMAQTRATAQNCPGLLANVKYQGNAVQPAPVEGDGLAIQPQPFTGDSLPPCGVHNAPAQQRKSTELPLMIQIESDKLATLDRVVLKYAYDGSSTYFDMNMQKGDTGWVTVMLSCTEGQITDFDPSTVNYYIEGYDMVGKLVCGNGSLAQPYTVTMDPSAPVVSGLAGMPKPQTCTECPPWDQNCHSKGVPCFSDEECLSGQWCSDMGFCEGDVGDVGKQDSGSDDVPRKFYAEILLGSGAGYASAPNQWYLSSAVSNPNNFSDTYYSYLITGVGRGSVGGLPLRGRLGIMLSPRISLEVGMRMDVSAFWRKQKDLKFCADGLVDNLRDGEVNPDTGFECLAPLAAANNGIFGAYRIPDTANFITTESTDLGNSWLVNVRVKVRLINRKGNQFFLFGGLGYGHLYFAPRVTDVDLDGEKDRIVTTPGTINIEVGLGAAHYFNSHFGITAEMPVDFVFGEDSTFGLNTDLMVGISFGG